MKKKMQLRSSRGAAMIALVLCLFLFTALAGFFAFDASRAEMAKRELVAACDAASLTGTAMLATYDTSPDNPTAVSLTLAQNNSAAYGLNMFQKGSLLGASLVNANYVTSPAALNTTAPGTCSVLVALTNPNANYAGVSAGDPNGKAISVFAAYGYQPAFLQGFGGGLHVGGANYILNASSTGGLPQVDAVMVFDFSGSMDDFTKVTFIRRSWDGPAMRHGTHSNRVRYIGIVPPTSSTTLSDYIAWNYDSGSGGDPAGSQVNVLPPQNLASAGGNPITAPFPTAPQTPIIFDMYLRQSIAAPAVNDFGTPPGDCTLIPGFPAASGNTSGYCVKPYMGGPVPPTGNINRWPSLAFAPIPALIPAPPGPDQDQPNKPWLVRYDPGYLAPGALPVPTSGAPVNFYNGVGISGAWVTEDCSGSETAGGLLGNPGRYTDLVVNLADPGSPIIQPVACPDSFTAGGIPVYGGMSYTFDSTEPDLRLQGKTFNFPNMATIVEASRGNLDTVGNYNGALPSPYDAQKHGTVVDFTGSVVTLPVPTGVDYQLAYQRLAMLESQPFATAIDGAVNGFFYKLNGLADCRFGLVGFSTSQPPGPPAPATGNDGGISATGPNLNTIGTYDIYSYYVTYYPNYGKVWQSYTGSGGNYSPSPGITASADNTQSVSGGAASEQGFRVPRTPLNATYQNMNEVCSMPVSGTVPWNDPDGSPAGQMWSSMAIGANGLWNGRPMADTYTAEALDTAIAMFNNGGTYNASSRPASRKAIVFFTDGEPTGGITGSDGTKSTSIQAPAAKANGIAIFTIGLNMNGNAQLTADQQKFLGDNVPPNGPGLAYLAGNGGNFFQCGTSLAVRQAFINVARRLSQNQQ